MNIMPAALSGEPSAGGAEGERSPGWPLSAMGLLFVAVAARDDGVELRAVDAGECALVLAGVKHLLALLFAVLLDERGLDFLALRSQRHSGALLGRRRLRSRICRRQRLGGISLRNFHRLLGLLELAANGGDRLLLALVGPEVGDALQLRRGVLDELRRALYGGRIRHKWLSRSYVRQSVSAPQ